MNLRKMLPALGATLCVTLAACGGGGPGQGSDDFGVAEPTTQATLDLSTWQADFDWDAVVAGFNEEYPDVEVNVTASPFSDYFTRLQTQASSGELPDVFMMNGPNFQLYAANQVIPPVQPLVEEGALDMAAYPEAMTELYSYEGSPYAVPIAYDSIALWYNEALFEQAGVELPTAEWTWQDLHQAASDISTELEDDGVYGFAGGTANQELFYNYIFQAGGQVLNDDATEAEYDTEPARAALGELRDMVADGSSPSIETIADTTADELFKSGKAAMIYGGSFRVGGYAESAVAEDIQVAPMAQGEQRGMVLHGPGLVMSASGEQQDAAAAFLAYVGSEQAQEAIGEAGTTIPAYDGTQQAYLDAYPEWDLQVYLDAADQYAYPYPVSANTQAWLAVETETVPQILAGQLGVEEGTTQLDQQIEELLAEEAGQ